MTPPSCYYLRELPVAIYIYIYIYTYIHPSISMYMYIYIYITPPSDPYFSDLPVAHLEKKLCTDIHIDLHASINEASSQG